MLDEHNGIVVQKYALNTPVTESDLPLAQEEFDSLLRGGGAEVLSRDRLSVAGLPALEYEITVPTVPDGESRFVFLFDGATEYSVNCQSTPDERSRIDDACEQAIQTLEVN